MKKIIILLIVSFNLIPYFGINEVLHAQQLGQEEGTGVSGYCSAGEAAQAWASAYGQTSINESTEYISVIYSYQENGQTVYGYTSPSTGSGTGASTSYDPLNMTVCSYIHSHPPISGCDSNNFSDTDINTANNNNMDGYLVAPDGSLQLYDHDDGSIYLFDDETCYWEYYYDY
jgi:hypothetical protein